MSRAYATRPRSKAAALAWSKFVTAMSGAPLEMVYARFDYWGWIWKARNAGGRLYVYSTLWAEAAREKRCGAQKEYERELVDAGATHARP